MSDDLRNPSGQNEQMRLQKRSFSTHINSILNNSPISVKFGSIASTYRLWKDDKEACIHVSRIHWYNPKLLNVHRG